MTDFRIYTHPDEVPSARYDEGWIEDYIADLPGRYDIDEIIDRIVDVYHGEIEELNGELIWNDDAYDAEMDVLDYDYIDAVIGDCRMDDDDDYRIDYDRERRLGL